MNMELKRIIVPMLELKLDDGTKGSVVGYGGAFDNLDKGGDILDPKCFEGTLKEHKKAGTVPHMFFNHDPNEPVGDWEHVTTDEKGLRATGKIWVDQGIPKAEQTYRMLKGNGPKGLSIGFVTKEHKYEQSDKKTARRLTAVDLREISPVPYPMNAKALILSVKSALQDKEIITIREAEEILRDAGGFSDSEAKGFIAKLRDGLLTQRDAEEKAAKDLKELSEALINANTLLKGA
jgi:hypothetical protein